jgi:hypothetical protein
LDVACGRASEMRLKPRLSRRGADFVSVHSVFFQNANEREHKTRLRCIHAEQVRLTGILFDFDTI